ncbi:receptor-like protein 12, partial [Prunus avium]|uniref:Receptor-like protein 12 n=1 Tax=Prunus avium TaxID=42229 RepID=A0A6P5TSS7_PRUAV
MSAQPSCSSRKALQLTSLFLQILLLSFWTREGDGNRSNCSSWDGVECDEDFGHVVGLDLRSSCLYGSINSSNTLFRLVHLQRLELSDNHFNFSQIPSRFGGDLSSLTYLNLSNSLFSGEIPSEISKLSKLSTLDLYFNFRKVYPDIFPLKLTKGNLRSLVQNLTNIKQLHLNWVKMHFTVPDILVNASSLTSLKLGDCQLVSEYSLSWIASLTNLYSLSLASTKFRGKFPSFVANLTQLSYLGLGSNGITGQIPSWLMNLTQLTTLYLWRNNLQGAIPRSLFQLKNLEFLDLSSNSLSGQVEFDQFSQPKKLKELQLSYNKLSLQIITNLSATKLISCNLTEFPEILKYQSELQELPKWVWNATRETLLTLSLSSNFLTGFEFDQNPINLPWQNLYDLDLQTNMLQGSLPIPPQSIKNYMVGSNHYSGEISPSFCNLNHLLILDLSNNNLSGMPPQCLGNSSALGILMLTNNSFHGSIPQMCPDNNSLKMVDLSYNQLQGKIPRSMANCTQLEFLNLENNQISDIFPSWLGALPALRALILGSNRFHGMIVL